MTWPIGPMDVIEQCALCPEVILVSAYDKHRVHKWLSESKYGQVHWDCFLIEEWRDGNLGKKEDNGEEEAGAAADPDDGSTT